MLFSGLIIMFSGTIGAIVIIILSIIIIVLIYWVFHQRAIISKLTQINDPSTNRTEELLRKTLRNH
jgi:hypothetical protein